MKEYEIEQTSLTFKWTFDRMLPSLPGPGTTAFATLCKQLHPYGLTASKVTADAPTSRLGDAVIGFVLLENLVGVKLKVTDVEVYFDDLFDDDKDVLVRIVSILFDALREIDEDAIKGNAQIRIASHLKLEPSENKAILHAHLISAGVSPDFIPEAAIYKVNPPENSLAKSLRVFLASSILNQDALFVDVTADYQNISDIVRLAKNAEMDFYKVVEMLGLKERAS